MSYIQWNEKLSVGIVLLDNQHKQLLDLLNNMHNALTKGDTYTIIHKTLDALIDYSIHHFRDEEELLTLHQFPQYEEHKQAHNQLMEQVIEFQYKLNNATETISYELVDFLRDWLITHIMQEDLQYADFIKNKISQASK